LLAPSIKVPALMTVSVLPACEEDDCPTSGQTANADRIQTSQLLRTAHLLKTGSGTMLQLSSQRNARRKPPMALPLGSQKVALDSADRLQPADTVESPPDPPPQRI
jgi:hypothetical protein